MGSQSRTRLSDPATAVQVLPGKQKDQPRPRHQQYQNQERQGPAQCCRIHKGWQSAQHRSAPLLQGGPCTQDSGEIKFWVTHTSLSLNTKMLSYCLTQSLSGDGWLTINSPPKHNKPWVNWKQPKVLSSMLNLPTSPETQTKAFSQQAG